MNNGLYGFPNNTKNPLAPITPKNFRTVVTPGAGTFIVPEGVTKLLVMAVGAGQGGSASASGKVLGYVSNGGNAGSVVEAFVPVTPGQVISYTVGVGGDGGSCEVTGVGEAGKNGTATTVTNIMTARGGGMSGTSSALVPNAIITEGGTVASPPAGASTVAVAIGGASPFGSVAQRSTLYTDAGSTGGAGLVGVKAVKSPGVFSSGGSGGSYGSIVYGLNGSIPQGGGVATSSVTNMSLGEIIWRREVNSGGAINSLAATGSGAGTAGYSSSNVTSANRFTGGVYGGGGSVTILMNPIAASVIAPYAGDGGFLAGGGGAVFVATTATQVTNGISVFGGNGGGGGGGGGAAYQQQITNSSAINIIAGSGGDGLIVFGWN